jgi:hypothetical protein
VVVRQINVKSVAILEPKMIRQLARTPNPLAMLGPTGC